MEISRNNEEQAGCIEEIKKEDIIEAQKGYTPKMNAEEEDLNPEDKNEGKDINKEIKEETNNNEKNKDEYEYEDFNDYVVVRKNEDSDYNIIHYTKSDVELFSGLIQGDYTDDLNESMREFLKSNKNRFNNINPLRIKSEAYSKGKHSENKNKTKKMAIKELVINLKTQYILFNTKDFIRKYQIKANPYISNKMYRTIRIIRNACLYIYGIIMIFERPWFCYKGTTIPIQKVFNFKFIDNCEKKVEFMSIPFIYNDLLRVIEIIQTFIIAIAQVIKYKDEYNLKKTNTGVNKNYNRIQIISFISLFLSFVDLVFSLCVGKFPIVNFILRPFIYIFMIRRLRMNWASILKVIWKTKRAYFVLFVNMTTFSMIGYILFKKVKGIFDSFGESFLQLYILLSTCNFPDIMLNAMELSKFAILFFIIYISINYFILLSYLKTLYTNKYYEVNKRDCLDIIKYVIENKYNKHIFYGKKFNHFILKQKKLYSLNDNEYNNLLILFNLHDKTTDIFNELMKIVETTPEMEMSQKTKYGKYILESKRFEIGINLLCMACTATLLTKNTYFLIFQFLFSFCLFYEPIILLKHLGIKRFFGHHIHRVIFHFFNLAVLLYSIYLFWLKQKYKNQKLTFDKEFKILRLFISLRTIRIFVFLDKFRIIKNIYIIIRISKEMLYRNLLLLYSFFLLFSTLSILLTGGNIKKHSFDDPNDPIPKGYVHINFNDFGSSFIACFCLMMINNLNILVNSLTFQSRHKFFFQFYFATFYFFATLILINIIQTLLLEMYIVSDNSLSDKDKNKIEKIEEVNENDESDNNIFRINDDAKEE